MKGRSPINIAVSIIFTFVLTLVMVAFPLGIASAAKISGDQPDIVKPERSENLPKKDVSKQPIKEPGRVRQNEKSNLEQEAKFLPQGVCPDPRCPPGRYLAGGLCLKCPN